MKIVVTGTRGIPNILGGVETHCEELFPLIVDRGCEVTLIRRKCYVHDDLAIYKGVSLLDMETPKQKSLETIIHTIKAVVKAKKIGADIVHIHAIGPAIVVPLARLLGIKVVFTHHGPDYDRDKWGIIAKVMLKLGERFGVKFANEVIVISTVINTIIQQKYGRKDANLIYNGVPSPSIVEETDYIEELNLEPQKYVFAMGRFVKEKNFHQLIDAFSTIENKNGFKLVLAGDADIEDDYSKELKLKAVNSGVILPGFIKGKKLQELLSHACCFVLPSSHEGLPISLLEAMSYHLPVIVSDIPANLEVGLAPEDYFELGNIEMLSNRIQKIICSNFTRVDYNMSKYSWDHIADQTFAVYKKLLNL